MNLRLVFNKIGIATISLLASGGFALAADMPIVDVIASTAFEQGKKQCLLGIINRSATIALDKVRVTLIDDGRDRFEVGPVDLVAAQALVLKQEIMPGTSCSGSSVVFRVAFERQGVHSDMLISGAPRDRTTSSTTWWNISQLMGTLLGLFSGLLGGWVAHRWTMAVEREKNQLTLVREREKDRVAWRTELFKMTEPAFRTFLLDWNSSLVAGALQAHFDTLQRAVVVHPDIIATYQQTYRVLADSSKSNDQKQMWAKKLEREMRWYIQGIEPPV